MVLLLSALLVAGLGAVAARADVVITVAGSKVTLVGDDGADDVAIEPDGDGIAVVGLGGTLVDGSGERVTLPGVRRLVVKLHEGPDRLTLTGVRLPDGIDLRLGRGNDDVLLDRVDAGKARIQTGGGYDAVRVYGPSTLNQLSVATGSDWDFVVLDGVWVPGDLTVDTGTEDDDVTIFATEVGDDVDVDLGNDDDVLVLADVVIDDDTDLDGDDGDDLLVLSGYVWFEDDLDVDGFGDDWWW